MNTKLKKARQKLIKYILVAIAAWMFSVSLAVAIAVQFAN